MYASLHFPLRAWLELPWMPTNSMNEASHGNHKPFTVWGTHVRRRHRSPRRYNACIRLASEAEEDRSVVARYASRERGEASGPRAAEATGCGGGQTPHERVSGEARQVSQRNKSSTVAMFIPRMFTGALHCAARVSTAPVHSCKCSQTRENTTGLCSASD